MFLKKDVYIIETGFEINSRAFDWKDGILQVNNCQFHVQFAASMNGLLCRSKHPSDTIEFKNFFNGSQLALITNASFSDLRYNNE
jgi:hypothetical protein